MALFLCMGYKTIIINEDCKVSLEQNNFKVKIEEEIIILHMRDINCVIFTHQKTIITIAVISKMLEHNIAVILCNNTNDPIGSFLPFNQHSTAFKQLEFQIDWKLTRKKKLWKKIIQDKIMTEAKTLQFLNIEFQRDTLIRLYESVKTGDTTNREGLAAKYYFRQIFGSEYFRNSDNSINFALNYGYKIIASYISKHIVARGYLTQLGIHHIGASNSFNLTYDFIETFRVLVDIWVFKNIDEDDLFTTYHRRCLVNILNCKVQVLGINQRLTNAIVLIIDSYFAFLLEERNDILNYDPKFVKYDD